MISGGKDTTIFLKFANYLDFYADGGKEPESLLGDEVRVHATSVITDIQQVVDVQTECDRAQRIFATEVDDGTG